MCYSSSESKTGPRTEWIGQTLLDRHNQWTRRHFSLSFRWPRVTSMFNRVRAFLFVTIDSRFSLTRKSKGRSMHVHYHSRPCQWSFPMNMDRPEENHSIRSRRMERSDFLSIRILMPRRHWWTQCRRPESQRISRTASPMISSDLSRKKLNQCLNWILSPLSSLFRRLNPTPPALRRRNCPRIVWSSTISSRKVFNPSKWLPKQPSRCFA